MLLDTASRGGPARCDPTELEPVAGRTIWLRVGSFAISIQNHRQTDPEHSPCKEELQVIQEPYASVAKALIVSGCLLCLAFN